MKPDIKLFKALKEDSDYFRWEKHTHAMMGGTDMGELIDPAYVPPMDEALSFRNKCRWLYAIFDNLVQTSEGREIIRVHQHTQDGQAVLAALHNTAFSSTASEMKASSLYEEIVTMRVSTWSGTALSYIVDFVKKVEEYNDTVPTPARQLNSESKKALLERAVDGSRGLRDVKIRELHRIAEGYAPLDYPRYLHLLKETAKQIDKGRSYQKARKTNVHAGNYDADGSGNDDGNTQGSSDPLLAYLASRVPGSRMKGEVWGSLQKDTQSIWDQIPDEEKAKILQGIASNNENRSGALKKKTRFKANNHEMSGTNDSEDGESDGDQSVGTDSGEPTEEHRQVNEAKASERTTAQSNAHPGDIRRVLGKKKPYDKKADGKKDSKGNGFSVSMALRSHDYDSEEEEFDELGKWGADKYHRDQTRDQDELRHGDHPYSDWNADEEYWNDSEYFH